MSDEKDLFEEENKEETVSANEEAVNEDTASEEVEEVVQEEAAENEAQDVVTDMPQADGEEGEEPVVCEYADASNEAASVDEFAADGMMAEEAPQKKKGGKIAAIIAIVVAAVLLLGAAGALAFQLITGNSAFASLSAWLNPYNRMGYVNISGRTISEVAEQSGMSLEEFLTSYELPSNMKANTTESAAYYNIPVKKIAEMYGMDFATLKETLQLPDTIDGTKPLDENTPWGIAEGMTTLGVYVGEEQVEEFKQYYGLGEDVTKDTLWKDIRSLVDQKSLDERKAMEAEQEAQQDSLPQDDAAGTDPNAGAADPGAGAAAPNAGATDPNAGAADPGTEATQAPAEVPAA